MSYVCLQYHIVFATKERRLLLSPDVMSRLCPYIGGIVRELGGQMLAANGSADHIHVAMIATQKMALMDLVKQIKTGSCEWIHDAFPDLRSFHWQDGYAAFTVSHTAMSEVVSYVRGQLEHHRKATFMEELIALLEKHGIQYDERYLQA